MESPPPIRERQQSSPSITEGTDRRESSSVKP